MPRKMKNKPTTYYLCPLCDGSGHVGDGRFDEWDKMKEAVAPKIDHYSGLKPTKSTEIDH